MSKSSIFDNIAMLALIGILAGALGGLAIGYLSSRPQTTSSTAR